MSENESHLNNKMKRYIMDFNGRVAIVTGAGSSRGIGKTIATTLASYGAAVAVADMNYEGATAVAEEIINAGGKAIPVQVNVTEEKSIQTMVQLVEETFGRIDILCNNAGITQPITT